MAWQLERSVPLQGVHQLCFSLYSDGWQVNFPGFTGHNTSLAAFLAVLSYHVKVRHCCLDVHPVFAVHYFSTGNTVSQHPELHMQSITLAHWEHSITQYPCFS